ncbi:matrix protein [Drosophila sturtevanti sigmavirus]|uniref:Matrix protein n=1 Tax=Drosophila sturtevanti sigmavirus TaxID=1802946 RepID=A0A140D8M7_9RHAB|nr:matrix protein [Drosophila sturtevanti sigmavirus]AMK09251.1 matrix protein [Drosophila sturtevanti sigmavirus]
MNNFVTCISPPKKKKDKSPPLKIPLAGYQESVTGKEVCLPVPKMENWKLTLGLRLTVNKRIASVGKMTEVLGTIIDEYQGPIGFKGLILYSYFSLGYHLRLKSSGFNTWSYTSRIGGRFAVDRTHYPKLENPLKWDFDTIINLGDLQGKLSYDIEIHNVVRKGISLYELISEESYTDSEGEVTEYPYALSVDQFLGQMEEFGVKICPCGRQDFKVHEDLQFYSP